MQVLKSCLLLFIDFFVLVGVEVLVSRSNKTDFIFLNIFLSCIVVVCNLKFEFEGLRQRRLTSFLSFLFF